jgi:hypothetical protein
MAARKKKKVASKKKATAKKQPAKKKTAAKKPAKKKAVAKAPPKKRRPARKAKMTGAELTRSEQAIMERMEGLPPDDPRYRVLEAALAFKASWVVLAEHLSEVWKGKQYLLWGYPTFPVYCTEEIRVTAATAKKLVRSYRWLDEEAPEVLRARVTDDPGGPPPEVPDWTAISVLADARRELDKERVPRDTYLQLKQAAFDGEATASQLKKDLREAIPEELRRKPPPQDPHRVLRRALTASVKLIDALREWGEDESLLVGAEDLRDAIAKKLPRDEEQAAA